MKAFWPWLNSLFMAGAKLFHVNRKLLLLTSFDLVFLFIFFEWVTFDGLKIELSCLLEGLKTCPPHSPPPHSNGF